MNLKKELGIPLDLEGILVQAIEDHEDKLFLNAVAKIIENDATLTTHDS
jgi:hypothetical protein